MQTLFVPRLSTPKALRPKRWALAKQLELFYADESGSHIVEWTVLTVLIILATYVVMGKLRGKLTEVFQSLIQRQFSAP